MLTCALSCKYVKAFDSDFVSAVLVATKTKNYYFYAHVNTFTK